MKGSTLNPATETFGQARQGSVAAIIQVLNERLSGLGIRTRAVVADGMLQLLCEADTAEKLEKTSTVERVRSELETISPQRIKRVKINSRIVREEQLLWLEEINRDPENALLWSEIITLKRPFFVKRWLRDRHLKPAGPIFKDITAPETSQSSWPSKALGGLGLALLALGVGWLFKGDFEAVAPADNTDDVQPNALASSETASTAAQQAQSSGDRTADTTPPIAPPAATGADPAATSDPPTDSASSTGNASDAFAQAVRVASKAAEDGQSASTAAEWLDLAARWQKASDLMGNIPQGNEQYAIAQDRIAAYKANSQAALQKAAAFQGQ